MRSPSPQAVLLANDVFSFPCFFLFQFIGLDVTAAVAFAVVASVVDSGVVVASAIALVVVASAAASVLVAIVIAVALFWGGSFLPLQTT